MSKFRGGVSNWNCKRLLLVATLGIVFHSIGENGTTNAADTVGGYVDLSFNCDVITTCPQVCASSKSDCPIELQCDSDKNETLCNDGSCAMFCDDTLSSPCEEISPCATVTCATIDTFYESCKTTFEPWYTYANECPGFDAGEMKQEEVTLSWMNTGYVIVYCWVTLMTVAIVSWCWYK